MTEMTMPRVGQSVEWRDHYGRIKAAIVIATPQSIHPDGDAISGVMPPDEGRVHLLVLSFSGSVYQVRNAEPGTGPHSFTA